MTRFTLNLFLFCLLAPQFVFSQASPIKMIRALSGTTGKVVGSQYIFDEVRNRFIYPQDNSLTVYFECKAPKGDYALTAYWKDPRGQVVAISPNVSMQTPGDDLNSYWIFLLDPTKTSGIWTAEIRINGEPVGTHSFELVIPQPQPVERDSDPPPRPSLNELYRSISKSLVWVHSYGDNGRRISTHTGVVVPGNAVLTAFQSIDFASKIEIEFSNGAKTTTDAIFVWSRMEDWVLIKADTGNTPPIEIGDPQSIKIGEQGLVFTAGARSTFTIGAVDITGRKTIPGYGERIVTNPSLWGMTVGGPLLDFYGKTIGIIGGSMTQGISEGGITVTPIRMDMFKAQNNPRTLKELMDARVLTPPISETPVFRNGMITDNIPKDLQIRTKNRFTRAETVIVYTNWQRTKTLRKGMVCIRVYDPHNRLRIEGKPQVVKLSSDIMYQFSSRFAAEALEPGDYRVDVFWDDVPIWRTKLPFQIS